VSRRRLGGEIVRLGRVASTMEEAARLAAAGAPDGTLVAAEEQTAGRGRAGRSWQAPAGSAVLCSNVLRPAVPVARLPVLSLVCAVAVAEVVEAVTGLDASVKWPNDVWLGEGRKVAGVLLQARGEAPPVVILGVGINVNAAASQLPAGATSLAAAAGRPFVVDEVLAGLLDRLDLRYGAYLAAAGVPPLADWRRRAALLGEPVVIDDAGACRSGVMAGITEDGALLLRRADGGLERVVAGDLTRGPRRGGAGERVPGGAGREDRG